MLFLQQYRRCLNALFIKNKNNYRSAGGSFIEMDNYLTSLVVRENI